MLENMAHVLADVVVWCFASVSAFRWARARWFGMPERRLDQQADEAIARGREFAAMREQRDAAVAEVGLLRLRLAAAAPARDAGTRIRVTERDVRRPA